MPALHAWFGSGIYSNCAAALLSTHHLTAGGLLVALQSEALDVDAAWVGLEGGAGVTAELRAIERSAVCVRTSRSLRQDSSSTARRMCRKREHCMYTCVAAALQSNRQEQCSAVLAVPPAVTAAQRAMQST